MFDKELALSLLLQLEDWLAKIRQRSVNIKTADDFVNSAQGEEKFDSICMLFIAVGENLKRLDKITGGSLLKKHPEADWVGAMGFRDIIAHQYFQIDHEEVFSIIQENLSPIINAVRVLVKELR